VPPCISFATPFFDSSNQAFIILERLKPNESKRKIRQTRFMITAKCKTVSFCLLANGNTDLGRPS
jgi:hypothetical protein